MNTEFRLDLMNIVPVFGSISAHLLLKRFSGIDGYIQLLISDDKLISVSPMKYSFHIDK